MNEDIFTVPDKIKEKLKIEVKKKETVKDKILRIFYEAVKMGKKELSADEITAAYYNLYCASGKEKIKDKKIITLFLFEMKGGTKDNGVLESVSKGHFKLRETKK